MTVDEQMIALANNMAAEFGSEHVLTLREIAGVLEERYGTKEGSIIPSDYCYNRINDGINRNKPAVFEYLGRGRYRCLGEHFPYNGPIYHKPKSMPEIVIGKCVNGERLIASDDTRYAPAKAQQAAAEKQVRRKTSRDPGLKLRFEVLKRDRFTCRMCGASPAKDPSVELHIDHIIPWSKGGETVLDNLQALCSKCNLGKSDDL